MILNGSQHAVLELLRINLINDDVDRKEDNLESRSEHVIDIIESILVDDEI